MITFALQVYVTDAYTATGDVQKLGTTFLAYIPQDKVRRHSRVFDGLSSAPRWRVCSAIRNVLRQGFEW